MLFRDIKGREWPYRFFSLYNCFQVAGLDIKENIGLSCSVEGVVVQASGFVKEAH